LEHGVLNVFIVKLRVTTFIKANDDNYDDDFCMDVNRTPQWLGFGDLLQMSCCSLHSIIIAEIFKRLKNSLLY